MQSKQYAIPYQSDDRTIYKICVNFDSTTRTIGSWKTHIGDWISVFILMMEHYSVEAHTTNYHIKKIFTENKLREIEQHYTNKGENTIFTIH